MSHHSFMDRVRSFFGFHHEQPRNDFRNPIWGSDEDDDGDELYGRQLTDADPAELHREMTRHMQDMFKSFGNIFSDGKTFFPDDNFPTFMDSATEPENLEEANVRDYYLKPGYHSNIERYNQDNDLDGKISSNDISGLFKRKDDPNLSTIMPFSDGSTGSGKSFFQTIITTSVTKPDGSVETRRIVKDGTGVVEETTTQTGPSPRIPNNTSMELLPGGNIYNIVLSEFSSIWRNLY